MNQLQLIFSLSLTLFFFATSSILCRMALIEDAIDAYSFTFFRIFFGVITLFILLILKEQTLKLSLKYNWNSAFMLFAYAICFSYAYINLDAGLGALILFAVVQLTLIISAVRQKERLSLQKIFGIMLAFAGLFYLLYPNETLELSYFHVMLMILSGLAWGIYTLLGKQTLNPIHHTADNFFKALLMVMLCYFLFAQDIYVSFNGIFLAFLSGGITSALGYALWYYILPQIAITTSGVIQLIVPVISIFLGVLLLNEVLTLTLMISTLVILLGIIICIYAKN